MDENSLEYGLNLLDDIAQALKPIGMTLNKLDPKTTGDIPTATIQLGDGSAGWEVVCNVLPTHRDEVSTTFVQFYIQLTTPCPERRAELERFAADCNSMFSLGTLLVSQDCLCMKYAMAFEPSIAIEDSHLQASVFAFCMQAEDFARRGQAICQGGQPSDGILTENNR